jgi:hypothetical protein
MRLRLRRLSLVDRSILYDAQRKRPAGCRIQSHTGQITLPIVLFVCLGGMLISKNRNCSFEIASRCSMIASRHQPPTNGVPGSTIGQTASVKTLSERRHSSASASQSSCSPNVGCVFVCVTQPPQSSPRPAPQWAHSDNAQSCPAG